MEVFKNAVNYKSNVNAPYPTRRNSIVLKNNNNGNGNTTTTIINDGIIDKTNKPSQHNHLILGEIVVAGMGTVNNNNSKILNTAKNPVKAAFNLSNLIIYILCSTTGLGQEC